MNLTRVLMEILQNPVTTDAVKREFNKEVNYEVYPCQWDEDINAIACIVRFCSCYDLKEHLIWLREHTATILSDFANIWTKIKTYEVREHRVPCGRHQQYVDLQVFYVQKFPSFPSPVYLTKADTE